MGSSGDSGILIYVSFLRCVWGQTDLFYVRKQIETSFDTSDETWLWKEFDLGPFLANRWLISGFPRQISFLHFPKITLGHFRLSYENAAESATRELKNNLTVSRYWTVSKTVFYVFLCASSYSNEHLESDRNRNYDALVDWLRHCFGFGLFLWVF